MRGHTVIGKNCHIGPQSDIEDSQIGSACRVVRAMIVDGQIADHCQIGPFCYIRPGTVLAEGVKAGHFVELKKTRVGKGSKIPHLSYMGDAIIGAGVNVGCGAITCNYDGAHKYVTEISDGAFHRLQHELGSAGYGWRKCLYCGRFNDQSKCAAQCLGDCQGQARE